MQSKTATSLSFALFSLILVLAACQSQIERSREVEDADSPLLKGLLQETDLSGEWRWIRESTFQQAETHSSQNQPMLESAMRILTGDVGVESYYSTIVHGLERYQQDPPPPQLDQFQSAMGLTNTTVVSLSLVPLGESIAAKCWKSPGTTVCNVVTTYPHLLSNVVIYAPAEMNDGTLRQILDQVLRQSDQRIKAIVP